MEERASRQNEWLERGGWACAWIVAASALAHLWCLGSQFYLDDTVAIREHEAVRTGRFWEVGQNQWTYLWYVVQARAFGISAVGFHAVNWLLHTAVACVVFGFGRDFLRGKWPVGVAWFAGLLFAVHPLGSEIPNYARTQDLAWVTLFSLLAGWAMLRFLREGGGWKLAVCAVCMAGATISKGPGLFHALLAVGGIGLAFMPPGLGALVRRRKWLLPAGLAGLVGVMWLAGLFRPGLGILDQWSNPRFVGHGFTVARVFWEFAWRGVIPVGLSADHHIAETLVPAEVRFWNIPDRVALLAAAGFLGTAVLGGWLAWRKSTRLLGVCLLLYVATMGVRVLYLIPEFMPEYRIYPGMPWFCLGAAMVLAGAWKWMFPMLSPRWVAAGLLLVLAVISARRSLQWHDLDLLMADVLKRYPAQGRAVWELQDRDLAAGEWQAVIERQEQVWPEMRRRFIASLPALAPARELPSGHFSLAEVACSGRYAVAVSHAKSPAEGLRLINALEAYMRALRIDPVTNPIHWGLFKRDKALVLEAAGDYRAALECLRREEDFPQPWPRIFERISRKLEGVKRDS